jgi:PAS domain S-box-containing protein
MAESLRNHIREALQILEGCGPQHDVPPDSAPTSEAELAEILLRRAGSLVDQYRDASRNLDRMQKELAVFKKTYSDVNRMLEEKIEEFSLLRLVVDISSRAMSDENPLALILEKIITIVSADKGFIMLKNPESGLLEMHAICGQSGAAQSTQLLQAIKKVADTVVVSGKPYFADDISAVSGTELASHGEQSLGSLASFPLIIENRTIGVLILSSLFANAFGEETKRIMHIIAGHIAVAVENARLYGEICKTKEYLENLVETAGDAIFTLDADHKIVSWNAGAEVIFKRSKQETIGRKIYGLIPDNLSPMLQEKIDSTLESESIITIETDATRGDGKVLQIALTLSPIHGANGEIIGVSGIAKDMTERKEVEEELRRLNETKTNFISTVSHELRTPLTSIKSLTEVLLSELTSLPEAKIRRHLSLINEECDNLSELIGGVLDFQKLEAGRNEVKFEPVALSGIMRQIFELFAPVAAKNNIELKADFSQADDMTRVLGDYDRLLRILSNLVSNALKYTNEGGHVCIRLSREDDTVRLSVIDDGIGIPADEKDKVFEKFYRINNALTRKTGGTGLGLAITKDLVLLHKGAIEVDSEAGGGCRFNVTFPAYE